MKAVTVPLYCIDSYPDGRGQDGFHAQRLKTLTAHFVGIDKAHTHGFYTLLYGLLSFRYSRMVMLYLFAGINYDLEVTVRLASSRSRPVAVSTEKIT